MDITEFKNTYEHKKVIEFNNQVTQNPVVSVCVQTYQQANYITQCLDGILNQKTNFEYEILLGEDASTDGTRDICIDYAKKYPKKIRLFLHHRENNIKIGGKPTGRFNFIYNLYSAQGKYIAMCEGDDYWTNPLKLQKQVDFLEMNKDYGICFHKVNLVTPNNIIKEDNITYVPENYSTLKDFASKGNYIHTPSVIFRRKFINFPNEFELSPIGDFFLYMIIAKQSNIGFIKERMAIYRVGSGIWSKQSACERNIKTAYMFALLIKTKLFDDEIQNILLNRITKTITRFINEISPNHLETIGLNPEIRLQLYNVLLNRYNIKNNKVNKSMAKKTKLFLKSKLNYLLKINE